MKDLLQSQLNVFKEKLDKKKEEQKNLLELYKDKTHPVAKLSIELINKQYPLQISILETHIQIQELAIEYDEKFQNL